MQTDRKEDILALSAIINSADNIRIDCDGEDKAQLEDVILICKTLMRKWQSADAVDLSAEATSCLVERRECIRTLNENWFHMRRLSDIASDKVFRAMHSINQCAKTSATGRISKDLIYNYRMLCRWKIQSQLRSRKPNETDEQALRFLPQLETYIASGQLLTDYRSREFKNYLADSLALQMDVNEVAKIPEAQRNHLQKRCVLLNRKQYNKEHAVK